MAQELEDKKSDSVFDFLYVDHRRIGLYLSQFSEFGNLTNLVQSQKVASEQSMAVGVPGVAEGSVVEGAQAQRTHTDVERHFDTQWTQALNFLDEVQARKMLQRDPAEAHLGNLVLIGGALNVVNLGLFRRTWDAFSDQNEPEPERQGNRQQRRAKKRKTTPEPEEDISGMKFLASLDQPIFMVFESDAARFWSTLARISQTKRCIGAENLG